MNPDKLQADVRENKVKQGMLLKQSRHLKQWKQRWMVLTKTHLYSFSAKGQYKDPTEIIPLRDVETIKSYYKDQYKKPFTFRVESPDVNLHMSAKSSDEKWAWMTAIERMIERVIHPEEKTDTYNLIRETIKMSTAVRQTLQKKQEKQRKQSTDFTDHLLRKIKMQRQNLTCDFHYTPEIVMQKTMSHQEETFFIISQKKQQLPEPKVVQKVTEKVVIKKVEVPVTVQRVVEKIVKVPQIQQKIIEKIVYKDPPKNGSNSSLTEVLKQLITKPSENPSHIVNFVVYLLTSKLQQYQPQVLQFCLDSQSRRFFAEVFLLLMNQQTDESMINSYLKFLLVLYQNCNEYFYSSDLKALIGILIRQMQMNRSEFNQYLIMSLFKEMTDKDWWMGLNYRRSEIRAFVKELGAISGPENQYLAEELGKKI